MRVGVTGDVRAEGADVWAWRVAGGGRRPGAGAYAPAPPLRRVGVSRDCGLLTFVRRGRYSARAEHEKTPPKRWSLSCLCQNRMSTVRISEYCAMSSMWRVPLLLPSQNRMTACALSAMRVLRM